MAASPSIPTPSISVVVPTYNAEAFLGRTLDSALAQTHPAHEVIVVDDGSLDTTPAVCARYGTAIRYLRVENGGQQRARNDGVAAASGDWIALLDHDDLWHPDYLAEVAGVIRTCDVDAVFANSAIIHEAGARSGHAVADRFVELAPARYWESLGLVPGAARSALARWPLAPFMRFHPVQPTVLTVRAALYRSLGGFDPRMRGCSAEDFEFELRLLRAARVGFVWKPVAQVMRHLGNASIDGDKAAIDLARCLMFALRHHDLDASDRAAVAAELQLRLPRAIDGAFLMCRFDAVRRLAKAATVKLNARQRAKLAIACLPAPAARLLATALAGPRHAG
jgi:glycosyltransferase involved in cell wall biosynthesis